jgi:cytoskeletal protein CcmA (bactofilin family)
MRLFCVGLLLFVIVISTASFADGPHERTQFGRDIVVGSNDEVTDATCFGCTVRIRGHVAGDVTTFGGSVIVEDAGEVAGDTTTFGGDVRLSRGTKINGDVTVFGGRIRRDPEATVHGDVTNFGGPVWLFVIFGLPLVLLGAFIALIIWLVRRLLRPTVPAAA